MTPPAPPSAPGDDPALDTASRTDESRSDAARSDAARSDAARSAAALGRYGRRMRRARARYFAVVAVVVAVFGVFAAVVWANGEAAHVTLRTASAPPPRPTLQTPPASLRNAWHVDDRPALGDPVDLGTVVTFSQHTVRGRDVATGRTTWSYDRSDRSTCTAVQLGGITMAVYAVDGDCTEISAFHTDTGRRAWTRTLDEDGQLVSGRPTYSWTDSTLMMRTATVIYALDPSSGLDRWTYSRQGCRIDRAVLGTAGALISQNSTDPKWANVKFCGRGPQLFLRDATAGRGDDSKPDADQIIWNDIGNTDVPLTSGAVVSALNRTTRQVDRFSADKGKPAGTTTLSPVPPVSAASTSWTAQTDDADLLRINGHLYALDSDTVPLWSRPAIGVPTLAGDDDPAPSLVRTRISLPSATGVTVVDGSTGKNRSVIVLPSPPRVGNLVYAVGRGYLVGGRAGVTAYR